MEKAPDVIPDSVENMKRTFDRCTSLKKAPDIPDGVKSMEYTFNRCTKLQGTIRIDAEPTNYEKCFYNAATEGSGLIVTGSSSVLNEIIATGDASKITRGE